MKLVNSNNYLAQADDENFSYDTFTSELPDAIRYFSRNYWTVFDGKLQLARNFSNNTMFDVEVEKNNNIILKANKTKFFSDSVNIYGLLDRSFDREKWELFLGNMIPDSNQVFYDDTFEIPNLIDVKDDPEFSQKNIKYIKKESKYNFYSPNYESLVSDRLFDVKTIPYISALLTDPKLDTRTSEENLILTLGGLLPDTYAESLFLSRDYTDVVKEYYNSYADIYRNTDSRAVIEELTSYSTTLKLTQKYVESLKAVQFVPFPYHNEIKFSNLASDKSNFIHQLDNFGSVKEDLENFISMELGISNTSNFIIETDILEEKSIKQYDLKEWLQTGIEGNNVNSLSTLSSVEYSKLVDYIKKEVSNLSRSYDKFQQPSRMSEVVIYKIEKRLNSSTESAALQTFWFTPDNSDYIRYIDTQIKYGTEYYYTLFAYILVLGNEYRYEKYDYSGVNGSLLKENDLNNGIHRLKINNNRTYKIYEVEHKKFSLMVNEDPYTKPVFNLQKDNNNLRINILPSEINSFDDIKIIENRDFNILENIKKFQNNKDLIYCTNNNNESRSTLQIYKTTIKPINYLSFQGKLYKTLILENDKTFIDKIIPDIKYYYGFRYLNNHNVPSDMSKIYEVVLKNEDGYFYLDTKEIYLEAKQEMHTFKPFKKYLLIRPNMMQTQIQTDRKINKVEDIYLGPKGDSVWGKDFILRITSKKTNRVLEFNIKPTINRKKE